MNERKIGVLRSWNLIRGFGIIRVGAESSLERYWLHVSKIRSGTATPSVGSLVSFEVGPAQIEENRLPWAIRADIEIAATVTPNAEQGGDAAVKS